jgi:hypothetical protein
VSDRAISPEPPVPAQEKHGAILEAQAAKIQGLKDRLSKLEEHFGAREEILVAEAKGAAAAVASVAASQHPSNLLILGKTLYRA